MSSEWAHDLVSELDDQDHEQQVKTTYAAFGLATYKAQVFEVQVLHLAVFAIARQSVGTKPRSFGHIEEGLRRATLGQLFAKVRVVIRMPDDTVNLAQEAITLRNRLAHGYWYDHAELLGTSRGRRELVLFFQSACANFYLADRALEPVLQRHLAVVGITPEMLEREFESIKQEYGWNE